jgi:tetratricopeptide (TPR) repeat protein
MQPREKIIRTNQVPELLEVMPMGNSNKYPWHQIEMQDCALGQVSADTLGTPENLVYRALLHEANAKKAEAFCLLTVKNPFIQAKSFLSRGRLSDAKEILNNMSESQQDPEVLLEKTRLAFYNGQWDEGLKTANRALMLSPTAVTQMTLFQLQSVCFYEMGMFSQAMKAIEKIESIGTLFPNSRTLYYAQALKVRILFLQNDVRNAQLALLDLWRETSSGSFNRDGLLTLLRTEFDRSRIEKAPNKLIALAALKAAEDIGDRLYIAFSKLDLWALGVNRLYVDPLLKEYREEFARIDGLLKSIETKDPSSTTARILLESIVEAEDTTAVSDPEYIIHLGAGVAIQLNDLSVRKFKIDAKHFDILRFIGNAEKTKEELFHTMYGGQKYIPRLHENILDTQLSRIRKETGVILKSRQGLVFLENCLVLK